MLEEALKEIDEHKDIIEGFDDEKKSHFEEITELETKCNQLQSKCDSLTFHQEKEFTNIDSEKIATILSRKLTPSLCLNVIQELFPNNIIVLPSAFDSSMKISQFKNCPKLLLSLHKLCTEYRVAFLEKGDNEAKKVFGDNYAANESETVENNKELCEKRTFDYMGERIKMFKHISLGNSRDKNLSLRIHFHADNQNNKIVIGHCGEHLPIKST